VYYAAQAFCQGDRGAVMTSVIPYGQKIETAERVERFGADDESSSGCVAD
jgi:hypothetical protein